MPTMPESDRRNGLGFDEVNLERAPSGGLAQESQMVGSMPKSRVVQLQQRWFFRGDGTLAAVAL